MDLSSITAAITNDIETAIAAVFPDVKDPIVSVTIPTQRDKADFVSDAAFRLAKVMKTAPLQIANAIIDHTTAEQSADAQYTLAAAPPGFINATLTNVALPRMLESIVAQGENYGKNNVLAGQRWVIEHTSPNPNKAMHVGHLRNNLIGMSVANIAAFSGADVIRDCIDNDRGIAIARAMWGFLQTKRRDGKKGATLADWVAEPTEWLTPTEENTKPDYFVGACYMAGAQTAKQDLAADKSIRQLALDWENGDESTYKLWELIINYAHQGIDQTLSRIGSTWDVVWREHEHYKAGRDMIMAGLKKGVFKRLDDGAVLTQLDAYQLPDTIVLKSDGTSLYITQDIALTRMKKEQLHADKFFWVIGPEQSLAMKQVFAICEQLGVASRDAFTHLPYGLVSIIDEKTGAKKKMSSRDGNTIYIDALIDEVKNTLLAAGRGYDNVAAEAIAVDTIKFSILKPARVSNSTLDLGEIISLKGDSGIYVLYSLSRMNSLLQKAGEQPALASDAVFSEEEHKLAVAMMYLPAIIQESLESYAPNVLVEYLLNVTHAFNSLYAKEQFITEGNDEETAKKILLTKALSSVVTNTLLLLGIKPVSKI